MVIISSGDFPKEGALHNEIRAIKNEDLHNLRKKIDALIQESYRMKDYSEIGREVSLVHTKLQEAKMWCGKCLEKNGLELPKEFQDKAE